jgi:hypothetical protein
MLLNQIELLKRIRSVLTQYCNSAVYNHESNDETRIWIANIYMAISLFELGLLVSRTINTEEEFYFSGSYIVSRFVCDSEWREISFLYDEIIKEVKAFNYFRE